LLYLAKAHGKFKWRFVLPGVFVVAAIVCVFWHSTVDTAPWYVKRLDFGRPSAQHRVAAWNAAFQMMRDHPFGVGWNKAVETYDKNYSPPEDGAAAITTNDYLMLGTQLGIPGLVCFVAYVGLCLRGRAGNPLPAAASPYKSRRARSDAPYQTACRAGAVTMLVAFWFDGGLFKLATAAVFWILLELGVERGRKIEAEQQKAENSSPCPSPHPTRRGESLLRALRSFVAIKSAFDIRHSEINQSLVTLAATK
jgi:O-antigen ligase